MGKSIKETVQIALEEIASATNDSIDGDHIFTKKSKKNQKKKDTMADVMVNQNTHLKAKDGIIVYE